MELDLIPTASYDTGAPRYITSDPATMPDPTMPTLPTTKRQFFGVQTAATIGTTLRAAYTFTPELSLQLYTQLFLARVRYGPLLTFLHTEGARERVPLSALTPAAPTMPMTPVVADSDEATLNVNLVLRWEYRLGSTLFLVYTRAQNPALMPAADGSGFQIRPIWQGRASADFIMLKLSYWWG
jgi:hypothetical protein